MKTLTLNRVGQSDAGTFGVLLEGQIPFAVTLEPPWRNNEKNISCIPPGEYLCLTTNSPQHGFTFQVSEVKNRTLILFHTGNIGKNTKGCILVGEQYEPLNGFPAVLASAKGYKEFMYLLRGVASFNLNIKESFDKPEP